MHSVFLGSQTDRSIFGITGGVRGCSDCGGGYRALAWPWPGGQGSHWAPAVTSPPPSRAGHKLKLVVVLVAVVGASAGLPGDPLGGHQGVQVLPARYDERCLVYQTF